MYTNKKVCYNFKYRITQQLREVIDMIKKEMIAMLLAGGQGSRLGVLTSGGCEAGSGIWGEIPYH